MPPKKRTTVLKTIVDEKDDRTIVTKDGKKKSGNETIPHSIKMTINAKEVESGKKRLAVVVDKGDPIDYYTVKPKTKKAERQEKYWPDGKGVGKPKTNNAPNAFRSSKIYQDYFSEHGFAETSRYFGKNGAGYAQYQKWKATQFTPTNKPGLPVPIAPGLVQFTKEEPKGKVRGRGRPKATASTSDLAAAGLALSVPLGVPGVPLI